MSTVQKSAEPMIPFSSQYKSGLEKNGLPMALITRMQSTTTFLLQGHFGRVTTNDDKHTGDPGASLLLISEKAVFCNYYLLPETTLCFVEQ